VTDGPENIGLLVKCTATDGFWSMIHASPALFPALTMVGVIRDLVAVTIGNVVRGAVFVASAYRLLYRRSAESSAERVDRGWSQ
jgi:formate/nitrite transporter FocA (FNT family)